MTTRILITIWLASVAALCALLFCSCTVVRVSAPNASITVAPEVDVKEIPGGH